MSLRKTAAGPPTEEQPIEGKTRAALAIAAADDDDSDDYCSYCRLTGELVVCEAINCRRVYHASCLGFTPPQHLPFHCPSHFCALCGKPDRQIEVLADAELVRCIACPSAYCAGHVPHAGVGAAVLASSPLPPLPEDAFMALLPVPGASVAVDAPPPQPPQLATPSHRTAPLIPDSTNDPQLDADPEAPAGSGQKRKRPRRSELRSLLEATLAAPPPKDEEQQATADGKGPGTPVNPAASDSGWVKRAAAGRANPFRPDRESKGCAPSGRSGRFKCPTCSGGGGARFRLARTLERVWSTVVNSWAPLISPALLAPVTDADAVPVYLAAGHTRRSLGLPTATEEDAAAAEAPEHATDDTGRAQAALAADPGAAAPVPPSGGARRARGGPELAFVRRFVDCTDDAHAHAILTGARELDALPATPCTLDDLLACVRAGKYAHVPAFVQDVDAMLSVVRTIGRSRGRSAIAQLPCADRLLAAGDAAPGLLPLPPTPAQDGDDYLAEAAAAAEAAGAAAASLSADTELLPPPRQQEQQLRGLEPWVLTAEHLGQALKDAALGGAAQAKPGAAQQPLQAGAASEAPAVDAAAAAPAFSSSTCAGQPQPLPTAAPLGGGRGDRVEGLLQRLALGPQQAAARVFAAKAGCLHPELSRCAPRVPDGRPIGTDRLSAAAWSARLASPAVSGRQGAVERLKGMTTAALRGRREPILLGFSPSSERWAMARPPLSQPPLAQCSEEPPSSVAAPPPTSLRRAGLGAGAAPPPLGRIGQALLGALSDGRGGGARSEAPASFDQAFARWVRKHLKRAASGGAAGGEGPGAPPGPSPADDDPERTAFRRRAAAAMRWAAETVQLSSSSASSAAQQQQQPRDEAAPAAHAQERGAPARAREDAAPARIPPPGPAAAARASRSSDGPPAGPSARASAAAAAASAAATPLPLGGEGGMPWDSMLAQLLPAGRSSGGGSRGAPPQQQQQDLLCSSTLRALLSADSGAPPRSEAPLAAAASLAALVCALGAEVRALRAEVRELQQGGGGDAGPPGGFPYAPPRGGAPPGGPAVAALPPPDLPSGAYSSYGALGGPSSSGAPPSWADPSSSYSSGAAYRLSPPEADAAAVLAELAPADVDGDVRHLGALLPPSSGEVAALLEAASGHARRTVVTVGELRAAWAASRRGMFSVPAAEARLCIPAAAATSSAADGGGGGAERWAAAEDEGGAEAGGAAAESRWVTLGEGRWALECALANRGLRARLAAAEAALAAERLWQRHADAGEPGDGLEGPDEELE